MNFAVEKNSDVLIIGGVSTVEHSPARLTEKAFRKLRFASADKRSRKAARATKMRAARDETDEADDFLSVLI